jgi:polar amino acid transport system substrate-binding protein
MVKKIITFALTILLVVSMVGCGSKSSGDLKDSGKKEQGQLSSVDKIKQKGKIVVGTEATFPPFEGISPKDGKTVVGFDMDVAAAVAKKLGVELEIVDMSFEGLIPSLETEKIDFAAAGINVTEKRAESVDFSQIYYKGGQVLVVKENNGNIKKYDDLKGKKIGAQLGTTSAEVGEKIEGANFETLNKVDQLMLSAKNGIIDGVVVDDVVGVEYVNKMGGLKIVKIPEFNEGDEGMGVAVAKGNKELLKVINDTLNELKANGEFDKLTDKWGLLSQK